MNQAAKGENIVLEHHNVQPWPEVEQSDTEHDDCDWKEVSHRQATVMVIA